MVVAVIYAVCFCIFAMLCFTLLCSFYPTGQAVSSNIVRSFVINVDHQLLMVTDKVILSATHTTAIVILTFCPSVCLSVRPRVCHIGETMLKQLIGLSILKYFVQHMIAY